MKKTIKVPIVDSIIIVYQNENIEDSLKQAGLKYNPENSSALTFHLGFQTNLVIFDEQNCKPGIIAHEAKHIVNYIFTDMGYKLDNDNDEMECYFLEWVVNQLHKYLKVN